MTVAYVDTQDLGTLAVLTGLLKTGPTMTRGGKLLSVRGSVSISVLTAGDGPFLFGFLENGISLAQLEAYLELNGPVSPDVIASREIASRGASIRTLGILEPKGNGTTGAVYLDNQSMKGLKFGEENAGWSAWIYNLGKAMTTGAIWNVAVQFFVEFNPSG